MADSFTFPEAFTLTDAQSLAGQNLFVRSTRVQLMLLVVAGGSTAFSWTSGDLDWSALVAGVALLAAAGLRLILLRSSAHRVWYEGRAAAESIKTLSWRYAVGGQPFELTNSEPKAMGEQFSKAVRDVVVGAVEPQIPTSTATHPTAPMQELRSRALPDRKTTYALLRIEDQLEWYRRKAVWNRGRARFWGFLVLWLQIAAAVGAFL